MSNDTHETKALRRQILRNYFEYGDFSTPAALAQNLRWTEDRVRRVLLEIACGTRQEPPFGMLVYGPTLDDLRMMVLEMADDAAFDNDKESPQDCVRWYINSVCSQGTR